MKRLLSFSVLCCAMAIAPYAHGQITFGDTLATVEGNGGGEGNTLGDFTNTVFTVYNESVITAAGINPGDVLTGLAFRVDGGNSAPNFTAIDYRIDLGRSINSAGDLVDNFAANADANGLISVRTGALDFVAADYEAVNPNNSTGTANAFGPEITITDYIYTGGDLLVRISNGGRQALADGSAIVESRADNVVEQTFNPDGSVQFANDDTQTLFGSGFGATVRSFGSPPTFDGDGNITDPGGSFGFAPIIQFSVTSAVPEPTSAALLIGLGLIGVARRRRTM